MTGINDEVLLGIRVAPQDKRTIEAAVRILQYRSNSKVTISGWCRSVLLTAAHQVLEDESRINAEKPLNCNEE